MAPPFAKPSPRGTTSPRRPYQLRPASRMFPIGLRCILIWVVLQLFGTIGLKTLSRNFERVFFDSIDQEIVVLHHRLWGSIVGVMILASIAFLMFNLLMAWVSRLTWRAWIGPRRNNRMPMKWVYAQGLGWGACQIIGAILGIRFCVSFLSGAIRSVDSSEPSLIGFWWEIGSQTLLFVALGCLVLGLVEYCFAHYRCRHLEAKLESGKAAS